MSRTWLYLAGALVLGTLVPRHAVAQLANCQIPLDGKRIPKFVDRLPTFAGHRVDGSKGSLTISMEEFLQQVLPEGDTARRIPGYPKTRVWGYEISDGSSTFGPNFPAFTIEAKRGVPLTVTYLNKLGTSTLYTPVSPTLPGIIPVDQTLYWSDPLNQGKSMTTYAGPVPAVAHLHGGEVQSISDGGPNAWFTPDNDPVYPPIYGPAWKEGVTNVYHYPNTQEAATLWFHDHALGVTRLNVYAGLAGFYFLRDNVDDGTPANGLGLPAGEYELELAIQDRMFDTQGQLYFPHTSDDPAIHSFWLPEFFGDVIVVNGKSWPYLEVEPRRYRFRFLDGSNARFYSMLLQNRATGAPGPAFWVIGTDGGLLDKPVKLDPAAPGQSGELLIAPGERFDVIVDFAGFAGQTLTLLNRAKGPYPKGTPADPQTVGQLMQFRVTQPLLGTDESYDPSALAPLRASPLVKLVDFAAGAPAVPADATRRLTLVEDEGENGPIEVLVNNARMMDDITEHPTEGTTEIWDIINLTPDAHPIHMHLVQFQLVSRQPFNVKRYRREYDAEFPGGLDPSDGQTYAAGSFMPGYGPPKPYDFFSPVLGGNPDVTPYLQGPSRPADPEEQGWKDTYKMYPGEVTTVIARWAPTDMPAATPKPQLLFAFDPSVGPGYVWHCHIIDHEDNEMMRPYAVYPNPSRAIAGTSSAAAIAEGTRPARFFLGQNYPNPFNPTTSVSYAVPRPSAVRIGVYDLLGREVATLVNDTKLPGEYTVRWDASTVPSGVYYVRMHAERFTQTRKLIMMK